MKRGGGRHLEKPLGDLVGSTRCTVLIMRFVSDA